MKLLELICLFYRLTGFLLGSTLSGAGMYYYVLNEYRVSNELLTEDIFVRTLSVSKDNKADQCRIFNQLYNG